jgi:hypothetical protein
VLKIEGRITNRSTHIPAKGSEVTNEWVVVAEVVDVGELVDTEALVAEEARKLAEAVARKAEAVACQWDAAEAVARQWMEWGQTKAPVAVSKVNDATVRYAVDSFLQSKGPQGQNVEASTLQALLEKRLIPHAEQKGFATIRVFDDLDTTTKFVESWRNLTDHKPGALLGDSTKKVELERLRHFFRYCLDREWMAHNKAAKIKQKTVVTEKFGMEPDEEARVFAAM